ncbi:IS3 family transposase [Corynebacterium diphtheriae]|nr:IS3 family transposase [Corynebacterium diphtheriae]
MYLATVIDLYLRKFAGFVIADHMRSSLVIEALDHANTARGGLDGAIFHSDHGSVYASAAFSIRCQEFGVIEFMGVIGTSADNALAGSCNSTVKTEVLRNRKVFANPLLCWREVFSVVYQMQDTAPALLVWTDIA